MTISNTQLRARHQEIAGDLTGAAREFIAKPARRGWIAFQYALKQAARDPDYRGMFQRDRGRRPLHRDNKRELTDQRPRPCDDFGVSVALDPERAALNDKSGVGIIACV